MEKSLIIFGKYVKLENYINIYCNTNIFIIEVLGKE
jgi:hypothetical protein